MPETGVIIMGKPIHTNQMHAVKPSGNALSRRQAVGLMLAGVLALAALPLGGCMTRRERRIMLAEDLLREKYGREFAVVFEAYGFDTATQPTAYCCAVGEEDLAFVLKFHALEKRIIQDTYVGRKLGRQVEVVITDCFAGQGIESASHVVVHTKSFGMGSVRDEEPDITLDDYLNKCDRFTMGTSIVIKKTEVDSRESPEFLDAVLELFCKLKDSPSRSKLFVVEPDDFDEYKDHLLQTAEFGSGRGRIENRPVDGFRIAVRDSQLEIDEDYFWM